MGVYVFRNRQVEGSFDELVLQQALANGTMSPDEQCCREGTDSWVAASSMFVAVSAPPKPPAQNVRTLQLPKITIPALNFRWRWSFLFWGPVCFYFLTGIYGCSNIGSKIQEIDQLKVNAVAELNQRNGSAHVASVMLEAAINGNRNGTMGALQPLMSEAEQQTALEDRIKEADDVLAVNREKQNGCIKIVYIKSC